MSIGMTLFRSYGSLLTIGTTCTPFECNGTRNGYRCGIRWQIGRRTRVTLSRIVKSENVSHLFTVIQDAIGQRLTSSKKWKVERGSLISYAKRERQQISQPSWGIETTNHQDIGALYQFIKETRPIRLADWWRSRCLSFVKHWFLPLSADSFTVYTR